jgi:hypothetical protein
MPLGPQIVTYGNVQSTFLLTVSLTFAATATVTTAEQTFTVNGLQAGDQISDITYIGGAFPNTLLTIVNARVSANNTLAIALSNTTAGSLTYPSGNYYIEVNRPLAPAMPSIQ